MPDNKTVYSRYADEYEALISREDYRGNILSMLEELVSDLGSRIVLDLGTGTGRLARLLVPRVRFVHAFDESEEMLRVCRDVLSATHLHNWRVDVADHCHLPVEASSATLAVSGWSVSYLAVWNAGDSDSSVPGWRQRLSVWMQEMQRVLQPGSPIVLYESLGTGHETPVRLPHLENFYTWLDENGFQMTSIRTDYHFTSLTEAEHLARFFFGDELGDQVKKNSWMILPECTGVWWRTV